MKPGMLCRFMTCDRIRVSRPEQTANEKHEHLLGKRRFLAGMVILSKAKDLYEFAVIR